VVFMWSAHLANAIRVPVGVEQKAAMVTTLSWRVGVTLPIVVALCGAHLYRHACCDCRAPHRGKNFSGLEQA